MQNTNEENNLILERYSPIETAGEGGYGKVIHAYDTRLKREVAIKVVELEGNVGAQNQTTGQLDDTVPGLAEARAAGKLANANIVTIYDCEVRDNKAYVIEEYVEGITLTTLFHKYRDEVNLDVAAHIFKSVATAVMAAHKESVLHLDIKPDNILIGRGGEVKVADFGLATLMDLNGEGSARAGTLGYMPLEQMKREPLDVRTDEWSLAMVTYEMLVGKNPFAEAKDLAEAEKMMLNAQLVVPSACWEELDLQADDAIFQALNVNRELRFVSVRQFMTALRTCLGDAHEGKKQLAVLVNGDDEKMVDTSTIVNKVPITIFDDENPVIDRLRFRGGDLIYRTLAALASVVIIVFAASNLSFPTTETLSFLQTQGAICCAIAICAGVFSWIMPRYGCLLPFIAIETMCNLNSEWGLMTVYGVAFLLWWSFLGRSSDRHSSCFLFSGLAGGFGFTPVSVVMAGAIGAKVSHSAIETAAIFIQALVFASFGSRSLFSWDVIGNFSFNGTPNLANADVGNNFLSLFANPCTWIICVTWMVAACSFALFCKGKSKTMHIFGALVCGAFVIVSAFIQYPFPQSFKDINLLNALSAVLSDVLGIILAVSGFTFQARRDQWEFEVTS